MNFKINNNIIDSTLIGESLNNYFINIGAQFTNKTSSYEESVNEFNDENVSIENSLP